MKTLHWDEVDQRWIHQDVTSWAVQWKTKASAMNSSTCPEPPTDPVGNNVPWFIWRSQGTNDRWSLLETSSWTSLRHWARRLKTTGLVQVIVNTPTLGPDIFFLFTNVYTWICNIKFFCPCFLFTFVSLISWSQSQKRSLS